MIDAVAGTVYLVFNASHHNETDRMADLKGIIFDLDGTLIDSSDGVVEAVNYSLRQMGAAEQPPDTIKPYIGYPLSVMYPHFTDAPVELLYRHFLERAADTVVASTSLLTGASQALEALDHGRYRLGIATTKVRAHVDPIIERLGWEGKFAVAVGGDEVARVKPAPDIFLEALDRLDLSPDQALVVGDTVNDVVAAQAVPMRVVAVASPYGRRDELIASKPDFFIESIAALPALIERLERGDTL